MPHIIVINTDEGKYDPRSRRAYRTPRERRYDAARRRQGKALRAGYRYGKRTGPGTFTYRKKYGGRIGAKKKSTRSRLNIY